MVLRAFLATALALASPAALAHSEKEIVTPADNATVAGSPPKIGMVFDEAMRITQIRLSDQGGTSYSLRRSDRMQPVTDFAAQPQELPPGAYTVEWRGISLDGHTMDGRWSFTVR
jgi:methionine-rich copper-binding protein CopC